MDVPVPEVPIREWLVVHDLMDYGDIEETIYRELFRNGCIRIELKLSDKDGVVKPKGKVYYISDPESVETPNYEAIRRKILSQYAYDEDAEEMLEKLFSYDCINIKQSAWVEYNNMLGNNILY